jgi:hypothetical protein
MIASKQKTLPKSWTGSTSGRPKLKISNISTVHRPIPLISVRRAMISSSVSASHSGRLGTSPASQWRAKSMM